MRCCLILISLFILMTSACSKLRNTADEVKLTCGIDDPKGQRIYKVDSQDVDALFITQDNDYRRLQVTAKGCLQIPESWEGSLYVRDKNKNLGITVTNVSTDSSLSLLQLSHSDRLVQKTWRVQCPDIKVIQNQLILKALGSDDTRAQLPAAVMNILNSKNEVIDRRNVLLKDFQLTERVDLADGDYRLSLENFDAFNPDVREPALNCEIKVDSSRPLFNIAGAGVSEVRPGQALTFPVADDSGVQIFLCAKQREQEEVPAVMCKDDEYLAIKEYVAPESGIWDLSYFAKDQAGNISLTGQQTIAVFHRELIEQIRLLSKEFHHLTDDERSTEQFKAFKTYQKLVGLAGKLTLKAEIREVYWKLLGNFATVSKLTLISRTKLPQGPLATLNGGDAMHEIVQTDPKYPYRMTIVPNGFQYELKFYHTKHPKIAPLYEPILGDFSSGNSEAIIKLHPKIPYFVYVAAGRYLRRYDLRQIYTPEQNSSALGLQFRPVGDAYKTVAAEHGISHFDIDEEGELALLNTSGGWSEKHAFNTASKSLWPHEKLCGRVSCRFDVKTQISVSYDDHSDTLVWQSDRENLERSRKIPGRLFTWQELDDDSMIIIGRDGLLQHWEPRGNTMTDLGKISYPYVRTAYHPAAQVVILQNSGKATVVLKEAGVWKYRTETYRGDFLMLENPPLPVALARNPRDASQYFVDIYGKDFKVLKTLSIAPWSITSLNMKDSILFYINHSENKVERINILKQEMLEAIPIPAGYKFEADGESLVFKKWNGEKQAFEYFEFLPRDGRMVRLPNYLPDDGKNPKGTLIDADGERFLVNPDEYFFRDDFTGVHIDRDDKEYVYKDEFKVDPAWFDERLKTSAFYNEPE